MTFHAVAVEDGPQSGLTLTGSDAKARMLLLIAGSASPTSSHFRTPVRMASTRLISSRRARCIAEADMFLQLAGDVEPVRVLEVAVIPVGGAIDNHHATALGERHTGQFGVLRYIL